MLTHNIKWVRQVDKLLNWFCKLQRCNLYFDRKCNKGYNLDLRAYVISLKHLNSQFDDTG